jgi:dihydropteroate synthase
MHNRGRSREMYRGADYRNVVEEVTVELDERVRAAAGAGIPRERVIVDPGIGFAKRAEHSLTMLAGLPALARLDRPVLVGPSRKSYLKAVIGDRPVDDREWATAAAVTASVLLGAHIVRVHGVAEMIDVVRTADAIRQAAGR